MAAGDPHSEIPESGVVFTFGRSRFANNAASHFFIRNDPVVEMSCGDEHTAVVCQNGRVFAFGSNSWGQLGLGHKNTATMPSCIKSLKPERATHVACGKSHTIVSTVSGKVFAFGSNMDCQLGLGDTEERSSPVEVAGIGVAEDGVRMLAAGCQHSAVLTGDGGVYVWGSNSDGQLGLGESVTVVDTPKRIDVPHVITFISCGYYHTALVTEEGKLLMCGEGENGKLGLSRENGNAFVPTPVNINVPIRSVACGGNHTIAVTMDGDVYGFGSNLSGQLGLGREVLSFSVPECIETLLGKHVCAAACGEIHTAFLTVEGHMYVCGDGRHGKLCIEIDNGAVQCAPQIVSRFSQYRVKQVACGGCHTMVQAVLESDANKSDSDTLVNGDVSLRMQKTDSNENEKSPSMEAPSRVLPPLQNAPAINGFPEKHLKKNMETEKTSASPLKEPTISQEAPQSDTNLAENHAENCEVNEKLDSDNEISENKDSSEIKEKSEMKESDSRRKESQNTSDQGECDKNQGEQENGENGNDVLSKFNICDASDLRNDLKDGIVTGDIQNGLVATEDASDEIDTARTLRADDGEEVKEVKEDDRRCSTDITPTLTVTGADGVDLVAEGQNMIADGEKTMNKLNLMASLDKGEGRMAKFLNVFRRKKLCEENVSVNAAWTEVDRRISRENNLRNGKQPSQTQLRSGEKQKSRACVIQ